MPFSGPRKSTRKRTRTTYQDLDVQQDDASREDDSAYQAEYIPSVESSERNDNSGASKGLARAQASPSVVNSSQNMVTSSMSDAQAIETMQHNAPDELSQRQPKGKKLQAGKQDTLVNFLGGHVNLHDAMLRRQVWLEQIYGPVSATDVKINLEPVQLPPNHSLRTFDLTIEPLHDQAAIAHYVPASEASRVEFVRPSNLTVVEETLRPAGVYDHTKTESGCRSFTICTGLANRTVAWAPSSRQSQFLAAGGCANNANPTPLFSTESHSGSIQIWQVIARSQQRACNLQVVFLHDFGPTWQLKWCPMASGEDYIGWLAALCGDGSVKVWAVEDLKDTQDLPIYYKMSKPAYDLRLPESACVSFDWLSTTQIAVGCANGMSATWDLSLDSAVPLVVGQAHSSYINNVVSCGPSIPETILTTGWDCDVKMSNVRALESDFIAASKERTNLYAATWCDALNAAVTGEDLYGVRVVSLRTGVSTSVCSMAGTVTALACHANHPFVAIGDASGAVKVVNLFRKILSKKMDQFQRKVYQLDYATKEDRYRYTENFRPEALLGIKAEGHSAVTNIYPRETTIHCVAWNPNAGHEALLASCCAKFVRIDDLVPSD